MQLLRGSDVGIPRPRFDVRLVPLLFVGREHFEQVETSMLLVEIDLKWAPYPHETIGHSQGEYVRGKVHTQTIESFWSLLKRGIMGSYHKVSGRYLPLYLAEFTFRFNNRKNPDIFSELLSRC